MPKVKTHSASKKRFKKLGSGAIKRAKGYRRHHAWAKSAKQIRQLRNTGYFADGDAKNIQILMPY